MLHDRAGAPLVCAVVLSAGPRSMAFSESTVLRRSAGVWLP